MQRLDVGMRVRTPRGQGVIVGFQPEDRDEGFGTVRAYTWVLVALTAGGRAVCAPIDVERV